MTFYVTFCIAEISQFLPILNPFNTSTWVIILPFFYENNSKSDENMLTIFHMAKFTIMNLYLGYILHYIILEKEIAVWTEPYQFFFSFEIKFIYWNSL